jgi:glycosyltransferase involved in cell wall biosynthesis
MRVRITVFTPTFNRADTLARAYRSLLAQTVTDFEWLVIDDGSAVDTSADIREWQQNSPFPIRYEVQHHQGKHCAHNTAVAHARGELFAVLDDDDALVPQALERLMLHWNSIPASRRDGFTGVSCLCMDQDSRLIGAPLPCDITDCRHYEIETRFHSAAERWGFHKTEVLRHFPFPVVPDEEYCPEGIVWNRIAQHYLVRCINEPLRIFYRRPDTVSGRIRTVLMRSPHSARLYYRECLQLDAPWLWRCRRAVNYVRYSRHAAVAAATMLAQSNAPLLTGLAALPGYACYVRDCLSSVSEQRLPTATLGRESA